MPATYEPIATTTLGAAASTITFSSISSAYTDLKLIFVAQGGAAFDVYLRFNSDSGTNYSQTVLSGNGTAASSYRGTGQTGINLNSSAGMVTSPNWLLYEYDIFSYAGATNKTVLFKESADKNGSGEFAAAVGLWRNTAAITSITLASNYDNFSIGSTATLYGILKA